VTDVYPRSIGDLSAWARTNGVTVAEARHRFAQFVALCSIASVPALRESLVLKGGNALDFVWQPNRSTADLDFSLDMSGARFAASIGTIRTLLERGFRVATARFGVVFSINSVRQNPPGEDKTFITYSARVDYGLPDEAQLLVRMANNQPSPHLLPIDISINEPIGDSTFFTIDENVRQLRVSTREDIVAEKLRALLQQPIRRRNRRQDVLDIAIVVRANPALDRDRVAAFLRQKADARAVPVSKAAFRNPEVAERARVDYDALETTTRTDFIPFDAAIATVLALVDELPISDEEYGRVLD
jgi:predicted nucleotidyltransferase component of viral defense system